SINLNQNLWGLVVCYAALGIAQHWCLGALFWLSLVASVGMTLSVLITTGFYTWNYCKKRQGT
ncbi:MAG TPA: hypothetical protein VFO27_20475, partial [Bryobacteraceae bacterium]|nr:hypothetical protein [Bryobacteraceae bacterium]